jgi:uncharacterized membrane protein (DUF106 family)
VAASRNGCEFMTNDGMKFLAGALIVAIVMFGWIFRYQYTVNGLHVNRFTNALCWVKEECWFHSMPSQ